MNIEYYRFEVTPYLFAGQHGGLERVLHVTVQVNGETHHFTQALVSRFNQQPWESEVAFYARIATKALEEKLKELEDKENDKARVDSNSEK